MFAKNAKRTVAVVLAAAMMISTAACTNNGGNETPATTTPAPTAAVSQNTPVENTSKVTAYTTDYTTNITNGGSMTTKLEPAGGGEVSHDVYAGIAGKDYSDPKVYTFSDYTTGMADMKWSTHTWETNDDSYILDEISMGFYDFVLNSTKDGWSIIPEMAAELPVDVTSSFVGKYGIEAGDTAKAWKIALNKNACWEDGTKINADSYIYSYKELLDPVMKNRRADSMYSGEFEVVGAKAYVYQGSSTGTALGVTTTDYIAKGGSLDDLYVDCWNFWNCKGYVDANGNECPQYVRINDETVYGPADDEFSGKMLYEEYFAPGQTYEAGYSATYLATVSTFEANFSWDNVGIVKTGEYEIVFILTSSIDSPNYYVPYYLSSVYLVYEPLWESCKTYFDSNGAKVTKDSKDIASITTTYCTSQETTMSFGPYRLSYFELDKQITMTRNEKFYGYSDGKHVGQYQIDVISCQVIPQQATALLAFLNGEIDNVGLVSADMATYGSSAYIRYTPQSYTTKLSFNTDLTKTTERGTNSQVMTNLNFRKGFALAIDRAKFASAYTSAGSAGYGMLNYMYVYDPFTGAAYRNTDGAKKALVDLYGLTYGDNGDFEDLDEAYDAITGFDITAARACMAKAYDELTAAGTYDGTSDVKLDIRVYSSDDTYVQMFNYLNGALQSACEGTKFDGKVSMTMTVDADYYNTNYSGNADMIFTTWGGAAYSPFGTLYRCYCDASDGSGQQMEYGFDTSTKLVTVELDGKQFTKPLQTWALWGNSDKNTTITSDDGTYSLKPFMEYDAQTRANLFGLWEYAYLSYFATTPLYYRNTASLMSQKGDYAVKTYVDMVGFGGLRFYTCEYDDEAWAQAVKKGLSY